MSPDIFDTDKDPRTGHARICLRKAFREYKEMFPEFRGVRWFLGATIVTLIAIQFVPQNQQMILTSIGMAIAALGAGYLIFRK